MQPPQWDQEPATPLGKLGWEFEIDNKDKDILKISGANFSCAWGLSRQARLASLLGGSSAELDNMKFLLNWQKWWLAYLRFSECQSRSGTAAGTCASGFGVCCVFVVTSTSGTIRENCTYIQNEGFPTALNSSATSGLSYTIGKCNDSRSNLQIIHCTSESRLILF